MPPKAGSITRAIGRFSFFLIQFVGLVCAGCEPDYVYTDCWLPLLRTTEPVRTLINVGDHGDRTSDKCPVPVPRTFELERPYGTVNFEWWGSPHRLYISASRQIDVRGDGIEDYRDEAGSWLSQYSQRKTFAGESLLERPLSQRFGIEVFGADGQLLEMIDATYDTALCSCSVPEYMGRSPDPGAHR